MQSGRLDFTDEQRGGSVSTAHGHKAVVANAEDAAQPSTEASLRWQEVGTATPGRMGGRALRGSAARARKRKQAALTLRTFES